MTRAAAPPLRLDDAARWLARLPRLEPMTAIAATILIVVMLWAVAPGWFSAYRATDLDFSAVLSPPSAAHIFGTDYFGRDVLSLIIYGTRQSLLIGIAAVAVGAVVGSAIGLTIGYLGGVGDWAVMRLLEVWMSIPTMLLVIVLATVLRPSVNSLIITIGVVSIPHYIRIMRSQVMAVKTRPFVEASRSLGASHVSILVRHVAPHTVSVLLVMMTLGVGTAMLTGAALSFIGLGLVEDRPDWGALISQGRSYLTAAWWFVAFPSLAVTLVVVALNLVGEALRARFDPRSQLK